MSLPSAQYRVNGDGSIDELIDPSSIVWGPPRYVPSVEEFLMSQREVITFICDNCGVETDHADGQLLPTGWVEIQFTENLKANEPVQACELCTDAVAKALAERRGDIAPSK
jgi:hypothetical protein